MLPDLRALVHSAATREETEAGYIEVSAGGGSAEIYGVPAEDESTSSLMVSRLTAGAEDLVVEIARVGRMTILIPGGPVGLTAAAQADHLPTDLTGEHVVLRDGADLVRALKRPGGQHGAPA